MSRRERKKGGLGETVRTVVYAVAIAVVIRTFAYEPFNIPSESMLPTLLVGDYLFVSKFSYGYSRHSLPFSPSLFRGRIFALDPKRGDVAVFKTPSDNSTDYIKRIVGLPGDRIQMRGGVLHVNDEATMRSRIDDFVHPGPGARALRTTQYRETLPGGRAHRTLDLRTGGEFDDTDIFTVPPGFYFAMGDNRDNSMDSRVSPRRGGVGMVPAENLVGRAEFLFFSKRRGPAWWAVWDWPFAIRYARLFRGVSG